MARRIYYVVNDGEDDWAVRLNDGAPEGHTARDIAVRRALDAAAADHARGHDVQVQVLTELGFELHWQHGMRLQ